MSSCHPAEIQSAFSMLRLLVAALLIVNSVSEHAHYTSIEEYLSNGAPKGVSLFQKALKATGVLDAPADLTGTVILVTDEVRMHS
jgi:hypothetical protein